MLKRYGAWCAFLLLLAVIVGQSLAIANDSEVTINRTAVFDTIKKGYTAQFELRGKHLSTAAIYKQLSPYFTDNFLQAIVDENSTDTKGSGEHLLSKSAPFTFRESTRLVYDKEHEILYVYEYMRKTSMYEVLSLQPVDGAWKLAGYHSNPKLLEDIQALEKQ